MFVKGVPSLEVYVFVLEQIYENVFTMIEKST